MDDSLSIPSDSLIEKLSGVLQPLIVETMPHLVFVKDREQKFRYANPAMLKFYGCDMPEQILGKTDREFSPDDSVLQKFRADDNAVIGTRNHGFQQLCMFFKSAAFNNLTKLTANIAHSTE